jgi:hypothetical protein
MIECVPEGQTVNQEYYLEVLAKLRKRVWKKRPEFWKNSWIVREDNAPAHIALAVKQFLADKCILGPEHYSTALNSFIYYLII